MCHLVFLIFKCEFTFLTTQRKPIKSECSIVGTITQEEEFKMLPSITGNKEAVNALGKIMIHWGSLDSLLQNLFTRQLKLSYEIGWITYDALGTLSNRIEICTRLANTLDSFIKFKDKTCALLAQLDKARTIRNNLAHGIWCQDDTGQIFLLDPRTTKTTKVNTPRLVNCITDTFVIEHEKDLLELTVAFSDLLTEIDLDNQSGQ